MSANKRDFIRINPLIWTAAITRNKLTACLAVLIRKYLRECNAKVQIRGTKKTVKSAHIVLQLILFHSNNNNGKQLMSRWDLLHEVIYIR